MRVISGKARGKRLKAVQGFETRPTADRIKENIFNMLAPLLYGCRFLDLFSGTGAVGIEALSRGAEFVEFVDNSPKAVDTIKHNLSAANLTKGSRLLCIDFRLALKRFSHEGCKFDVIFLDPPYKTTYVGESLGLIAEGALLYDNGFVVVESEGAECGAEIASHGFEVYKHRNYGRASIAFLKTSTLRLQ